MAFETLPATVGLAGSNRVIAVRDRVTGTVTALNVLSPTSIAEGIYPRISTDASTVVFSTAYPFDPTDVDASFDVYAVDLATGTRTLVSKSTIAQTPHGAVAASISATGRFVTFTSREPFDAADTNAFDDAFVADRATGVIERVSVGPGGVAANSNLEAKYVSDDGRGAVFDSNADNLVAGDTNNAWDSFLRDRAPAAAKSLYGTGVAGGGGTAPTLSLLAMPVLGTSAPLYLENTAAASTVGLLVLGFQSIAVPFLGGTLLASPDMLEVVIVPVGGLTRSLAIPDGIDFAGITLFLQGLELDTFAVGGVSFTRGLRATIGG